MTGVKNHRKLLSPMNSAPSNCSLCKISWKMVNPIPHFPFSVPLFKDSRDRCEVNHSTFLQSDEICHIRATKLKLYLRIYNCILSQQPFEILEEYDNDIKNIVKRTWFVTSNVTTSKQGHADLSFQKSLITIFFQFFRILNDMFVWWKIFRLHLRFTKKDLEAYVLLANTVCKHVTRLGDSRNYMPPILVPFLSIFC